MSNELQRQKIDLAIHAIIDNVDKLDDIAHEGDEYYFSYVGKNFAVGRWRSQASGEMVYGFHIFPNFLGSSEELMNYQFSSGSGENEEVHETYQAISFDSLHYPSLPLRDLYDAVRLKSHAIGELLDEIIERSGSTVSRERKSAL